MARVKKAESGLQGHEAIALGKAVAASEIKGHRSKLTPGIYPVDMTVHVKGVLQVELDTQKTPTVRIGVKSVMGLFLARSGALRETNRLLLQECISEVIREQIATNDDDAKVVHVGDALREKYEEEYDTLVASMLSELPKTPVKGDVTFCGETMKISKTNDT